MLKHRFLNMQALLYFYPCPDTWFFVGGGRFCCTCMLFDRPTTSDAIRRLFSESLNLSFNPAFKVQ